MGGICAPRMKERLHHLLKQQVGYLIQGGFGSMLKVISNLINKKKPTHIEVLPMRGAVVVSTGESGGLAA
jgi:hypothetical protein